MHTLTNAREREGQASARAEWPGRPAGPWPALELELQGAGKRPRPGKATRSRSPPDGMATSPQHPPHGAKARGRGGGGSHHAGRCTRGAQSSSRGLTCTGPGGGHPNTSGTGRQGPAEAGAPRHQSEAHGQAASAVPGPGPLLWPPGSWHDPTLDSWGKG